MMSLFTQLLSPDQGSSLDSGLSLNPRPYIRSIHRPCPDVGPDVGSVHK